MSFITQFKIEFLLPFTGSRKVLGKMPGDRFLEVITIPKTEQILTKFVFCN